MYYIYNVYHTDEPIIIMIKHKELKEYDDDIFFDEKDIILDTGWELSMHNQETEYAIYPSIEVSWIFNFPDYELDKAYEAMLMIVFEEQDNIMDKLY